MLKFKFILPFINSIKSRPVYGYSRNVVNMIKFSRSMCSSHKSVTSNWELNLEVSYTPEQQSNVLKVLNESSLEELLQYSIKKRNANNLIKYRKKYGGFGSISSLLEIDGFGMSDLEWICDAVTYGIGRVDKRYLKPGTSAICEPKVADELKKNVESIVSYRFHLSHLLWLHLTRDMRIVDWSMQLLPEIMNKTPYYYCPLVNRMKELLPKADAYVTEDRLLRVRHLNHVQALCATVQIESMLHMLYYNEKLPVFVLKRTAVSNMFNIRLGNDRLSSDKVVKDLLDGFTSSELRKISCEDKELVEWYEKQKPIDKQELGNCLLQAVAFYETQIANR